MLKVGELASRSGLTVRTLHHYDSIGLLTPSARSDAGYRLYNRNDIARLHRIQALRRFGMALADIAAFLDSPDASPAAIIGRQIAALDQQIADAAAENPDFEGTTIAYADDDVYALIFEVQSAFISDCIDVQAVASYMM